MKHTAILFLIVASFLSTVGCKNENADKIERIDSLYAELNAIEDSMQSINIGEINGLIKENNELINRVDEEISDTLTKEQMFFFSDFKRYRKSLTQLRDTYMHQLEQVGFSKTQLENLKEDVQNGLVVDEAFGDYFNSEKEAVERNAETTKNLKSWYNGTFKRYNELKQGVEKIFEEQKK